MPETIDCLGLSCPEPVLKTRQELKQASADSYEVLVSNAVARDNVKRAAGSMGWKVSIEEIDEGFRLDLKK